MRTRQVCRGFLSVTIAVTTLQPSVLATKAKGYKSTSLAGGRLGESDTSSLLSQQLMEEGNDQPALSAQETERMSDIYVQSNVWAAGGSTGWHSHPGHSVIIVTAGTVTKCMYTKQG